MGDVVPFGPAQCSIAAGAGKPNTLREPMVAVPSLTEFALQEKALCAENLPYRKCLCHFGGLKTGIPELKFSGGLLKENRILKNRKLRLRQDLDVSGIHKCVRNRENTQRQAQALIVFSSVPG
jgi:hypothetical protein